MTDNEPEVQALAGRFQLSLDVGRFMSPEMSPGLRGLVGSVDIFTIWVTVLLAIGIAVVGKLRRDKAILAGVLPQSITCRGGFRGP